MPSLQQKRKAYQKNTIKKMQTNLRLPLEPSIKQNLRKESCLRSSSSSNLQVTYQMCFKAERGFKTHGETVREGINTDGERDCIVNRAASNWQPEST